jgi:hypothetical protein
LAVNHSTYHNDTSTDRIASLKQAMLGARGGLKAVVGAMRFSKDLVVGRFLAKHDCLGV